MSSCLVLQQYNKIFIGADSAISGIIENKIKRISNNGEKIFKKDNYIIFCSGDMCVANKMIQHIKTMNKIELNKIQSYIRDIYNKNNMFEIFIADCRKENIITYSLSSYRNFDFLITKCKKEETQIYALGFKTKETLRSAYNYIKTLKGNVEKIYKNTFDDNCCEEIGGELNLYYSIKGNIKNKKIQLNDSCVPMINHILNKNECNFLTADYLVGKVLLGENLALDSDNGCFYIGDGDNVNDEDKGDFGLYVFDKVGTEKVKRIFLGIQQQNNGDYQARLELYSKEGDKVVLSDEGVMQTDTNGYEVYLDHDNSAYVPFYIDEGVKSIDKFLLRIRKGRLRSTTKSTETSLSANINIQGQTVSTSTSAEGSHNHTVTINIPAHYHLVFGSTGIVSDGVPKNAHWGEYVDMNDNKIYLPIATASGLQTEPLYTRGEGGKYVSTVTSNATGSHSHTVNISGSSQHLNLSHNHKLQYGIFTDSSIASVVAIYVNGNAVNTHITGGSYEVDIKDYIKIGGWNEIEFRANGNCCISFAYFMKSFNKF